MTDLWGIQWQGSFTDWLAVGFVMFCILVVLVANLMIPYLLIKYKDGKDNQ